MVGVAKLEAENETQKCGIFYIFISSVQLKSLGQTNLLVLRQSRPSLLFRLGMDVDRELLVARPLVQVGQCRLEVNFLSAYGGSKPQLKIGLNNLTSTYLFVRKYKSSLSLPCLSVEGIIHGRADIHFLTLSLEAYKESRQKKILVVKHRNCLLYTSPSPRDRQKSRMPSSA